MKTIRFACMSLAAALVAAACGGSTSADTDEQNGGAAGAAGSAGTSDDGGAGGATADASTGPDGAGAAGDDDPGGGDGTAGTGGGGGGGAADAGNACTQCLSSSCPNESDACQQDSACACIVGCLGGNVSDVGKIIQCGLGCGGIPSQATIDAAKALVDCASNSPCLQTCAGGLGDGGLNPGDGGLNLGDGGLNFGDGGLKFGSADCQACREQNCSTEEEACQKSTSCACYEEKKCTSNPSLDCLQCGNIDDATKDVVSCSATKCKDKCL